MDSECDMDCGIKEWLNNSEHLRDRKHKTWRQIFPLTLELASFKGVAHLISRAAF